MSNNEFFGTLERVSVIDRESSRYLGSGEAIIGCRVSFDFTSDDDGAAQVKVVSPHGDPFGAFSKDFSHRLTGLHEQGRVCTGLLTLVGYVEGVGYWGEFAVLAYPPQESDIWERFIGVLSERYADGKRVDVDMTLKTSRRVIESGGTWCDLKNASKPDLSRGDVIVKHRRTSKDDLIEKAASGNKGCVVGSVVFWIVLAALIVFLVWWFLFR